MAPQWLTIECVDVGGCQFPGCGQRVLPGEPTTFDMQQLQRLAIAVRSTGQRGRLHLMPVEHAVFVVALVEHLASVGGYGKVVAHLPEGMMRQQGGQRHHPGIENTATLQRELRPHAPRLAQNHMHSLVAELLGQP